MERKLSFLTVLIIILLSLTLFATQLFPEVQIKTARTFVEYLASGNFNSAEEMLTPKMSAALPLSKLSAIWESLQAQSGKYEFIANLEAAKSGEYVIVVVNTKFEKAYLNIKVVLDSKLKIAGLWIAPGKAPKYSIPSYVDLNKFSVKKLEIGDKWKLPAELTIPKGKGPFPAVVLIPGSGPSDMNESIGPNEPFKDLAYGLSSMGIAVLRYDKRTYVYGVKVSPVNVENVYLQDASYAINYMLKEPFVSKVFVLGHSLGGYLAPEIAKENKKIAGIIMLAASERSLATLIIDQFEYLSTFTKNEAAKEKIDLMVKELKLLKAHKLKSSKYVMGAPAAYYYELEKYSPVEILKTLSKPVLICQGGKDYQVTMKDFSIFKKAFGSSKLFTFKWYPSLSHIFTPVEGVPSPLNYEKPSHVYEEVVKDVANWIKEY